MPRDLQVILQLLLWISNLRLMNGWKIKCLRQCWLHMC